MRGVIRRIFILLLLLAVSPFAGITFAEEPLFAVALFHTPVLNTPDFRAVFGGKDGKTVQKDSCGQLRQLEFVALPGTVFTIEKVLLINGRKVYRITTSDYKYRSKNGYFIEPGFVELHRDKPADRPRILPPEETILTRLWAANGRRYVWGGNVANGVGKLLETFPPSGVLSKADRDIWQLHGVDCSGLLYEATGGYTPRNTSSLISYGKGVKIAGMSSGEIGSLLKPLDLIVWPGHVMIVIGEGEVIESRLDCSNPSDGVRIRSMSELLSDIMTHRRPADSIKNGSGEFVVRRWYETQP